MPLFIKFDKIVNGKIHAKEKNNKKIFTNNQKIQHNNVTLHKLKFVFLFLFLARNKQNETHANLFSRQETKFYFAKNIKLSLFAFWHLQYARFFDFDTF
jgi:hypothetical protein